MDCIFVIICACSSVGRECRASELTVSGFGNTENKKNKKTLCATAPHATFCRNPLAILDGPEVVRAWQGKARVAAYGVQDRDDLHPRMDTPSQDHDTPWVTCLRQFCAFNSSEVYMNDIDRCWIPASAPCRSEGILISTTMHRRELGWPFTACAGHMDTLSQHVIRLNLYF